MGNDSGRAPRRLSCIATWFIAQIQINPSTRSAPNKGYCSAKAAVVFESLVHLDNLLRLFFAGNSSSLIDNHDLSESDFTRALCGVVLPNQHQMTHFLAEKGARPEGSVTLAANRSNLFPFSRDCSIMEGTSIRLS